MTYSELASLDSTPDQDLGLTIAFKGALSAGQTAAKTPGAYLAARVGELLASYDQQHVTGVRADRIQQALDVATKANDASVQAVAQALGVDLVVVAPDDIAVTPAKAKRAE